MLSRGGSAGLVSPLVLLLQSQAVEVVRSGDDIVLFLQSRAGVTSYGQLEALFANWRDCLLVVFNHKYSCNITVTAR
jgi:hypothetical protein